MLSSRLIWESWSEHQLKKNKKIDELRQTAFLKMIFRNFNVRLMQNLGIKSRSKYQQLIMKPACFPSWKAKTWVLFFEEQIITNYWQKTEKKEPKATVKGQELRLWAGESSGLGGCKKIWRVGGREITKVKGPQIAFKSDAVEKEDKVEEKWWLGGRHCLSNQIFWLRKFKNTN